MISVALAGNPNTGKTSLFNILTGSYEYVGNWTGVTVEKKVGVLKSKRGHLIDLPGIYSLNPLSRDEGVATQFLLSEDFSAILNIVDASQLERNLYLTVQLLEYGKPVVIGLNMMDVAEKRGYKVDEVKLTSLLNVPILPIVARTGTGCDRLEKMLGYSGEDGRKAEPLMINYGSVLEGAVKTLAAKIPGTIQLPKRWLALQFFEGNALVKELLYSQMDTGWLERLHTETEERIRFETKMKSLHQHIRQVRSGFISSIVSEALIRTKNIEHTFTERVDQIVTNKFLGMPVFLLFMYVTFKLTFDWLGTPLSDMIDAFLTGPVTDTLQSLLVASAPRHLLKPLCLRES